MSFPTNTLALLGLSCLVACGSTPDPGPFTINYSLDTESGSCASSDCSAYGLNCGAVLSVRITDAETGELVRTASGQGAQLCEAIQPSESLCGLANLPPGSIFFDLPPRRLRIEVAAWSAEVLNASPELAGQCPNQDIFDLAGQPLSSFSPQPAFAGASYFDAGSNQTEALVKLSCSDPLQVDLETCAPPELDVNALVIDLESPPSQISQPPLPESLLVRAAGVREIQVKGEPSVFELSTPSLVLAPVGNGDFATTVTAGEIPSDLCIAVLEETPQATGSVVCGEVEPNTPVDARGALFTKVVLDEILAALELQAFPAEGLVIGRVFDQDGIAIPGVIVTPMTSANVTVEYLNSSRDDTLPTQTFDNGYFIASGVPFGTEWQVEGAAGMVPVRTPSGGAVRNQLTVVAIEMRDDIGGS